MKKENWNNLATAIEVRHALLFHRYRDTIEGKDIVLLAVHMSTAAAAAAAD